MEKIYNYINGELVEPVSGNFFENFNPATGQPYSLIPDSNYEDINIAVKSAKQAFESWSQTTKKQRSDLLMDLADKIDEYSEELILAESKDNGKPENLARIVDIPRASENFRFFVFCRFRLAQRWRARSQCRVRDRAIDATQTEHWLSVIWLVHLQGALGSAWPMARGEMGPKHGPKKLILRRNLRGFSIQQHACASLFSVVAVIGM